MSWTHGLGAESSGQREILGVFFNKTWGHKIDVSHTKMAPKIDHQNGTLEELASEASEQVTTDSPGEWFQRLPLGMTPGFLENWVDCE